MTSARTCKVVTKEPSGTEVLRPVRLDDLDRLEAIDLALLGHLFYPRFVLRQFFDLYSKDWFVVEDGEELCGYVLVGIESDGTGAWLLGLAVHNAYRGRGHGTRLLERALEACAAAGVRDVRITDLPSEPLAITMCETLGFGQLFNEGGGMWLRLPAGDEPLSRPVEPRSAGAGASLARQAGIDDLDRLEALDRAVFGELAYPHHVLRRLFDLCVRDWFVIEEGGELCGYVLVGIESDGTGAWLLGLAVHDAYRGRGYGARLMERALEACAAAKVKHVSITVRPNNDAAVALYEKFGFELVDIHDHYFGHLEERAVLRRPVL